jgi:hypothetical protein
MFKKVLVSSIIAASTCFVLCAQRGQVTLPDGPGKQAVESACQQCHALEMSRREPITTRP